MFGINVFSQPVKDIIIYQEVEIPFSIFPKYCDTTQTVDWCNGYILSVKELPDAATISKELIEHQKHHVQSVVYCRIKDFPKELKNKWGHNITILNTSYSPSHCAIVEYLKKKEGEKKVE